MQGQVTLTVRDDGKLDVTVTVITDPVMVAHLLTMALSWAVGEIHKAQETSVKIPEQPLLFLTGFEKEKL